MVKTFENVAIDATSALYPCPVSESSAECAGGIDPGI